LRVSIQVVSPERDPAEPVKTDPRDTKQIMNIHYMFDMCSATP